MVGISAGSCVVVEQSNLGRHPGMRVETYPDRIAAAEGILSSCGPDVFLHFRNVVFPRICALWDGPDEEQPINEGEDAAEEGSSK